MIKPASHRRASDRRPLVLIKESDIERTITEFLELDGWRSFKMEAHSDRALVARFMAKVNAHPLLRPLAGVIAQVIKGVTRGQGVGETGMCDRLFLRYHPTLSQGYGVGRCDHLWIEFKRPGEKPRPDQVDWHTCERDRGALVTVVGEAETWWEDFKWWYKDSGLARRMI